MKLPILIFASTFSLHCIGAETPAAAGPPKSYGVNYCGRYRAQPVKVTGVTGPDGARQGHWNNIAANQDVNTGGSATFTAEITDEKGLNPISITTNALGGAGGNDGGGPDTNDFLRLYNSGLRDGSGAWKITTTVAPFPGTYEVYVYAPAGGVAYGANTGDTTTWSSKAGGASGTFDLDENYHVFSGLTGPLTIYAGGSIAGFSIVDPSAATDAIEETALSKIVFKDIDGKETSLGAFAGKTVLLVNVASKCGFTPQYRGLEAMYEKFKDQGLVVIGFPCNDFGGQEPGTNEEIKTFCSTKYSVSFPLMDKVRTVGDDRHPLFTELCGPQSPFPGGVKWNFNKFVISKNGRLIARFESNTKPNDEELLKAVTADMARKQKTPTAAPPPGK